MLVERAKAGDPQAQKELAEMGHLLGLAIGSFVNIFGPDVIVIGGGFGVAAGEPMFEPALEAARREALAPTGDHLKVVQAQLGGDAGLIGAGLLALELVE